MESLKGVGRAIVRLLVLHQVRGVSRLRSVTDRLLAPSTGVEWRQIGPCQIGLSHLHEATRNMAYGAYERNELSALRGLLSPGDEIADVGANVGYLTAHFSALVGPKGRVHAFEPGPTPLRSLRAVAASCSYANIDVVAAAVSDREGMATFYETEVILAKGYGRLDERPSSKFTDIREYRVPVLTLGQYFEARGASRLRLVKLDVEGQERRAIDGMASIFAAGLRPAMLTEVTIQGGHLEDLKAYANLLFDLGYRLSLPESPNQPITLDALKPGSL